MNKFSGYILLSAALFLASCTIEEPVRDIMSPGQMDLIGTAVNFNVSVVDEFHTKGYTSNDNGEFNEEDRMRIYRNYWDDDTRNWSSVETYRTYYRKADRVAEIILLGNDWLPEPGRQGMDYDESTGTYRTFVQTAADSLTWDNGKTLRFRAWSQSNYHNVLKGSTRTYFYPDFCISDYVTASGPTLGIPLVLKHMGSRIKFTSRTSGNEVSTAVISTDWNDYKYLDNSDIAENDASSTEAGKTDEQAQAECALVTEIYNKMCMPAGVDLSRSMLRGFMNDRWNSLSDTQVRNLETLDPDWFYNYGSLSAAEIASSVKRPFFSNVNGSCYMITIPYDMSNDAMTQGEVLVLPPCTRFRVYMRDITGGDAFGVGSYEGRYHIFSLSDIYERDSSGNIIRDAEGNPVQMFPEGLKLKAGSSYTFRVGYKYDGAYIIADKDLSWEDEDLGDIDADDQGQAVPVPAASDYQWWKQAISDAIPVGTEDFRPVFHISNEQEFIEFTNLVNGTATTAVSGLYRLVKTYRNTVVGGQTVTVPDTYGWSTKNSQYEPEWIEESEAEALGYIFYDHYFAANADRAAYSERDYLKGPYPFFDDNLRRCFTVVLDADLDMKDWSLETIGNSVDNPFMGNFDGGLHTISNINLKDEYLFGYVNGKGDGGASITNLRIESLHRTALLNQGVNPIYIAGIALYAESTANSIAASLTMDEGVNGTSYVVGCIHVGDAGGALVGRSDHLNMFGCMQASAGLSAASGALLGAYADPSDRFFAPQISLAAQRASHNFSAKPEFINFMCNYYDRDLSSAATAVGSVADDYSLLEYIRGSKSEILRAKNDYLTEKVPMDVLLSRSDADTYYGLAPWHAMNYAIYRYNASLGADHPCNAHFEASATGYDNRYPTLMKTDPLTVYGTSELNKWNPLKQPN